jgi:hypothetical protein
MQCVQRHNKILVANLKRTHTVTLFALRHDVNSSILPMSDRQPLFRRPPLDPIVANRLAGERISDFAAVNEARHIADDE